jgi:methionyl-tRNA formyltransferase
MIARTVRAFTPWPGTFSEWNGRIVKILSGKAGQGDAEPGRVVLDNGRVAVGTSGGLFFPSHVQLAGKKPTFIDDFVRGHADFVGARLD